MGAAATRSLAPTCSLNRAQALKELTEMCGKIFDDCNTDSLSHTEFMFKVKEYATRVLEEKEKEEGAKTLKEQFDLVDTDGSGFVDHKELRALLKKTGASMSKGGSNKIEDMHIEVCRRRRFVLYKYM